MVTGAVWLVVLILTLIPQTMSGMPAMAAAGLGGGMTRPSTAGVLTLFLIGWVVMVAAMMLPTTIPMARMFSIVTSDVPARRSALTGFYGAYLTVWLSAGGIGLLSAVLITRATTNVADGLVLAGAVALAGAFQFSPLKQRCLTKCRDPRALLFAHYRRGPGAAWALGFRHAAYCLGCCWSLMAVMFAVGSGGLAWMLGLTAVMVAEKTALWGRRLVKPLGAALLVVAFTLASFSIYDNGGSGMNPSSPTPMHHHM